MSTPLVHHGLLRKRGQTVKNWKKRLFKLTSDGSLSYFESEGDKEPVLKGTIPMKDCESLELGEQVKMKWPEDASPQQCFAIGTSQRTFYMVAENEHFALCWLRILRTVCGPKLKTYLSVPVTSENNALSASEDELCSSAISLIPYLQNNDSYVLTEAASALLSIAKAGDNCRDQIVRQGGVVPRLVDLLAAPAQTDKEKATGVQAALPSIRLYASAILCILSINNDSRKDNICESNPWTHLKAMITQGNEIEKTNAAGLTMQLCSGDENRVNNILHSEVVDTLVSILFHGQDDAKLDAAALSQRLCTGERKGLFFAARAIDALMPLLNNKNHNIVRYVVGTIRNIACGNFDDKTSERAETILGLDKGMEQLLKSLTSDQPDIQRDAAGALWNLSAHVRQDKFKDHHARFIHAVSPLVDLLKAASPDVQLAAAGAIGNFARHSDEIREEIIRKGTGRDSAVYLLISHLRDGSDAVKLEIARAINNLADGTNVDSRKERAATLVRSGVVQPLVSLLANSPGSGFTIEYHEHIVGLRCMVLDALLNLAWGGDVPSEAIMASGGCRTLIDLLTDQDESIRRRCAQVIRNLAAYKGREARANIVVGAGAIDKLCGLLTSTSDETRVQGAAALRNLGGGDEATNPQIRLMIVATEAPALLLRIIKESSNRAKLQAACALGNIALSDPARPTLHKKGVFTTLVSLAKQTGGMSEDVRKAITLCIERLQEMTPGNLYQDGRSYVVISCAAQDADACSALQKELEARGILAWKNDFSLKPDVYKLRILGPIDGASAVIIACSPSVLAADHCKVEAEHAQLRQKKIVAVLLQPNFAPTTWLGRILGPQRCFDISSLPALSESIGNIVSEIQQ